LAELKRRFMCEPPYNKVLDRLPFETEPVDEEETLD